MASGAGSVIWKVVAIGAGIGAKKVVGAGLDKGWARLRGGEPPRNPAGYDTQWSEALIWAAASGAAIGIGRLFAARAAAGGWRRVTGALPPGLETVGA